MKIQIWGKTDGTCPQCNDLKRFIGDRFHYEFVDAAADENEIERTLNHIVNLPVIRLMDGSKEVKRVTGFNAGNKNAVIEILKASNV